MATILSPVALWLLWRRPHDPAAVTVAALIPIAYWAPFFPAAGLRGAGLEDPGVQLPPWPASRPMCWARAPPR